MGIFKIKICNNNIFMEMKPTKNSSQQQNEDEELGLIKKGNLRGVDIKEPDSHLRFRTFLERCGGIFCVESRNKLDYDELISYYTLKTNANVDYNPSNPMKQY